MDTNLIYPILALFLLLVFYVIRNRGIMKRWESRFKTLKIDVMLAYHPDKFEYLKSEFDYLFSAAGKDTEAIHILWKEFMRKYWKEFENHIINEK